MRVERFLIPAVALAFVALGVGCGNNSSTTPPATTTVIPTSTTVAIGPAAVTAVVLAGTVDASILFPAAATGSGTLTVVGSGSLPSGAPTLSVARSAASNAQRQPATTVSASSPSATLLAYLGFTPSATFTFASFPTFTLTLPSSVSTAGESFYIAFLAPGASAWVEPAAGPAAVSGQTLTFNADTVPSVTFPITLTAGQTYGFALYEVASSASPSPTPTASPTATPTPAATASPTATPTPAGTASPTPTPTPRPTATPTPSSTPSPTPRPTATPTPSPTPSPTATPSSAPAPTWILGGAKATLNLTAGTTPALISLSAYNSISLSAQFAAPNISGSLAFSDALNNGDVTPNTLPADNATAGFTPIVYLSIYNGSTATISFGTAFPHLSLTDLNGFGGATVCEFDVYSRNGGNSALLWHSIGQFGTTSGTTVTIGPGTLPPNNSVDFQPGQQVTAVACH